ncbi:MAG: glycosyltransferase [Cytophagales bacterium]
MKVLILCPYPFDEAPSQRFRFEQYFEVLKEHNIQFEQHSFLNDSTWKILYQKGHHLKKTQGILFGFLRRLIILFKLHQFDLVFIHREATPLGFPWLEFLIRFVWKKKFIYDFDDAIWLPNTSNENQWIKWLKFHQKTKLICKWAWKISVGNEYLADYTRQYNQRVIINPTTIDTEKMHNPQLYKKTLNTKTVIGWTGSHSTITYLNSILPILKKLEQEFEFEFLVISNKNPELELRSFKFLKWNKNTEMEDLLKMDIGLMPLSNDEWSMGKCGFKALQYMALEVPAIVSPVGINTQIIDHQINGFLCESDEEWLNALAELIRNKEKRDQMGKSAREKVINHYSVKSNRDNFLKILGDNPST